MPYLCATCDRPLPSIDAPCPTCLRSVSEQRRWEDSMDGKNEQIRTLTAENERLRAKLRTVRSTIIDMIDL